MINETDLDWLARNVHVWPTNTPKAILPGDATFKLGAVFYGDCVAFSGEPGPEYRRVNKADWLARRAELQNNPSWEDAPDWAEWLAQDDSGKWYWYASKPTHQGMKSWWPALVAKNAQCGKGEVLGDWRDTLEKRPEEFKPFTSIEDNQEQDMKQDNGWHERGELPPVGILCLYVVSDRLSVEVEITAHAKFGMCFAQVGKSGESYVLKAAELHRFRPIRTERDVLIEIIASNLSGTTGQVADAIIAAGFGLVGGA